MTSIITLDDNQRASERGVPVDMRRFTVTYTADQLVAVQLSVDIKVCSIENKLDQTLNFYVGYKDADDNLNVALDLHTANDSSRIEKDLAINSMFPVAQENEFNVIVFKAAASATGKIIVRTGHAAKANGLGAGIEVAELAVIP